MFSLFCDMLPVDRPAGGSEVRFHGSCFLWAVPLRGNPIACRVPFAGIGRRFSEVSVKVYKDYFQVL